jgi:hypothetical protein
MVNLRQMNANVRVISAPHRFGVLAARYRPVVTLCSSFSSRRFPAGG